LDILQGPAFGVSVQAGLRLLLQWAARLEEAGCAYKSAVGDPTGAELAEVAPTRARLEVVVAKVGLVEAALVGLAATEVVELVAVAELAAAEARMLVALHRKSDSFYTEALTRYHCIAQSLSFAAGSTCNLYLSLIAASFSFYDSQLSNLLCHLEC